MPELPDGEIYVEALERRLLGQPLTGFAILNVFALRSVEPPLDALVGRPVVGVRRLGKRIVLAFAGELFLVIHLMIAGRFRWIPAGARARVPKRIALAELGRAADSPIMPSRGCCRRTGRNRWTSWRASTRPRALTRPRMHYLVGPGACAASAAAAAAAGELAGTTSIAP